MLDWMTLFVSRQHVAPATLDRLSDRAGKVMKVSAHGEIEWCIAARDSVRSDSHQISVHLGTDRLELSGSPARVMARNNVFGSGDPVVCWASMVRFVAQQIGSPLPLHPELWACSRVDVTQNYALESAAEVRQALSYLRHVEGGRLQVRAESESVYWSPKSRMRSGKAYHKGPELEHRIRRGTAEAEPWQVELAGRLLRLELSLRREWWRRECRSWFDFTEQDFDREHREFFSKVIGKVEVVDTQKLMQGCEVVAGSVAQGRSAFRTWMTIREIGAELTRATMSYRTWHRHKQILFGAGLTFADFQASNVVPLRRRTIVLDEPVQSWDEIGRAA